MNQPLLEYIWSKIQAPVIVLDQIGSNNYKGRILQQHQFSFSNDESIASTFREYFKVNSIDEGIWIIKQLKIKLKDLPEQIDKEKLISELGFSSSDNLYLCWKFV
jgi:hypothetical protein